MFLLYILCGAVSPVVLLVCVVLSHLTSYPTFMHYGGCVPFVFACFFFDALIDYSAWNILCWNVRGLNDREKWEPIRNKIDESNANIFCLQETNNSDFDLRFIR